MASYGDMGSHPLIFSATVTFKASLDAEMKRVQSKGTRSLKKQAEVITKGEDELLWKRGLLGDTTPQSLPNT